MGDIHSHKNARRLVEISVKTKRDVTICVAKLAVQLLICAFVSDYAECRFSHAEAHILE